MRVGRLFLDYCSASNFNPKKVIIMVRWKRKCSSSFFSQTNHSGTVLSELL